MGRLSCPALAAQGFGSCEPAPSSLLWKKREQRQRSTAAGVVSRRHRVCTKSDILSQALGYLLELTTA
jgi:hypothetical protein